MKIVVIGAGKVGRSIIESVCMEGHDIIVIDSNPKIVNQLIETYNIMGICGNGATLEVQNECDISDADLVVAVTNTDEINILSCLLANKLGAADTIARVRNPEYAKQIHLLKSDLGISMTINPEYETAKYIARNLTVPNALKVESFAKGKMELIELIVEEDSVLNNINLYDINRVFTFQVLICAVQRNDEVFIPKGDFTLKGGDRIHIVASRNNLFQFVQQTKQQKNKIKSVMAVGGGKITYYLAEIFENSKYRLTVVDNDEDACLRLSTSFPNIRVINGDGSNQDILEEEGISSIDAMLSLTGVDEENIIVAMYARQIGVKKIITKVNNTSLYSILDTIGISNVLSPKEIIVNQIISYIRAKTNQRGSNVQTIYKIVDKKVEAIEFIAKENCKLLNVPFKDLKIKKNTIIGGIIRDDQVIIPNGNDYVLENDSVIVITLDKHLEDLNEVII